jgi:hypothetical protein
MSSISRRIWVLAATLCLATALSSQSVVQAHEIGTTRVSAVFHAGRSYEIEIVTDAAALVEKLEASAGRSSVADRRAAALESLLSALEGRFRERVRIAFDDSEARPEIAYLVAPGAAAGSTALVTVRMSGPIPPGARHFTWTYGWTFASYGLTVRNAESKTPATEWLEGGQSSQPFAVGSPTAPLDRQAITWRYLTLGFTHIVPTGLDHVLFVLGIYLLSRRPRAALGQVTAFTVAHSITLALSMFGLVAVPSRIVEPLIAVSIAYVAVENLFLSELKSWRIALVFAFGLLHGMGFAGALHDLGLPRSEFVTALVSFNAGVELGQLAVIATAFLVVGYHCADRTWYRARVVVPASAMIACVAVYWTVERLAF